MTVSLNGKVIGSSTFSPKLQSTHRRKLLQTDLLTSLFNIPLTVPLGTPPGLQVIRSFCVKLLARSASKRHSMPNSYHTCP